MEHCNYTLYMKCVYTKLSCIVGSHVYGQCVVCPVSSSGQCWFKTTSVFCVW